MIRKPTVLSQVKLYSGLEGAIVKRGKIGARAKISLTDFRNIYQDIRGTGLLLGHRVDGILLFIFLLETSVLSN